MTNKYEYEQDEPFGWYDGMGFSTNKNDFGKAISTAIPLYTHPAPQPAQEPVAVITPDNYGEPRLDFIGTFKYKATTAVNPDILLYTHPTPSWQGLSDDEIEAVTGEDIRSMYSGTYDSYRAIEQALKEKNT